MFCFGVLTNVLLFCTGYTFDEGPKHVFPVLFACLPGIDANDIQKSFLIATMFELFAQLVPIVDSSRSTAEMTEIEAQVNAETPRFEDLLLEFCDRCFSFVDAIAMESVRTESAHRSDDNPFARQWEMFFHAVFWMLSQCSPEIFRLTLRKFSNFITDRILETSLSGKITAQMCAWFSHINGEDTLKVLVPILTSTIFEIIDEDEDVIREEKLNARFAYYMILASRLPYSQGNNILPHLPTFMELLDRTIKVRSTKVNSFVRTMLHALFSSLTSPSTHDYK